LLKQQIEPLLNKRNAITGKKIKKNELFIPVKINEFTFVKVSLPADIFNTARELTIKTLFSPSDQGIRGITKGINSKKLNMKAFDYRIEQYKELFK
jgi:hypothetical protein